MKKEKRPYSKTVNELKMKNCKLGYNFRCKYLKDRSVRRESIQYVNIA
jgi:hypothetical protein